MRQSAYGTPLLINKDNTVTSINKVNEFDESTIQNLIFDHPSCLPISEIDEAYNPVIPVCMEMNTTAGPLDIFMVSPNGELTIIETKLWRNPEARRKVVAQTLDYAQVVATWSYSDLQREINRKTGRKGNSLYEIAREKCPDQILEEADFVDSVERNLNRGNFLLLIAGDGIREGAKGITEFLSKAGHLNFTFAMVELALYKAEGLGTLIIPRTLVKTTEISKVTVEIPHGLEIMPITSESKTGLANTSRPDTPHQRARASEWYTKFWTELVNELSFDDPSQPLPKVSNSTNLMVYPYSTKKIWISAYFMDSQNRVGVYCRASQDQEGSELSREIANDEEAISEELSENWAGNWRPLDIGVRMSIDNAYNDKNREAIKSFFKEELNRFVNVFRPRLKELN